MTNATVTDTTRAYAESEARRFVCDMARNPWLTSGLQRLMRDTDRSALLAEMDQWLVDNDYGTTASDVAAVYDVEIGSKLSVFDGTYKLMAATEAVGVLTIDRGIPQINGQPIKEYSFEKSVLKWNDATLPLTQGELVVSIRHGLDTKEGAVGYVGPILAGKVTPTSGAPLTVRAKFNVATASAAQTDAGTDVESHWYGKYRFVILGSAFLQQIEDNVLVFNESGLSIGPLRLPKGDFSNNTVSVSDDIAGVECRITFSESKTNEPVFRGRIWRTDQPEPNLPNIGGSREPEPPKKDDPPSPPPAKRDNTVEIIAVTFGVLGAVMGCVAALMSAMSVKIARTQVNLQREQLRLDASRRKGDATVERAAQASIDALQGEQRLEERNLPESRQSVAGTARGVLSGSTDSDEAAGDMQTEMQVMSSYLAESKQKAARDKSFAEFAAEGARAKAEQLDAEVKRLQRKWSEESDAERRAALSAQLSKTTDEQKKASEEASEHDAEAKDAAKREAEAKEEEARLNHQHRHLDEKQLKKEKQKGKSI
jgi:hypothetical protein